MMRCVGSAGRVVDHDQPVGLNLVQHLDVLDSLVGHRRNQVPFGLAEIRFDGRRVTEQIAGVHCVVSSPMNP
jgi:hypothetical protein